MYLIRNTLAPSERLWRLNGNVGWLVKFVKITYWFKLIFCLLPFFSLEETFVKELEIRFLCGMMHPAAGFFAFVTMKTTIDDKVLIHARE